MNWVKAVLIILGMLLLAAAAYYAVPYLNVASANAGPQVSETMNADTVNLFESFAAKQRSAPQYSYCIVKTVSDAGSSRTLSYSYTVNGKDYAIKAVSGDKTFRQIYMNGKYTFVDDTELVYYPGANNMGVPDVHFFDALDGRPAATGSEIVNGYQQDYVSVYKDGVIYIFYFDSTGGLTRFYYIYNSNSVTLDFCRIVLEYCPEGVSFTIPALYTASKSKPLNVG